MRANREVIQQYPDLEKVENEMLEKVYNYHKSIL
jgi:hypothetical protein